MLSIVFSLLADPKGPNSQLTQEQLAVLLNFLGQPTGAVNTAQFVQSMSTKVNQETLQQLSKALAPTDPAEPPPPQPTPAKPPQPAAPAGVPRTPPMPKPPSPPMSAPSVIPEGEAAAATQTAMTMLLAQLLQAQQGQRQEPSEAGEAAESTNPAGGAPGGQLLAPEVKQPPEPSPVSPGKPSSINICSCELNMFLFFPAQFGFKKCFSQTVNEVIVCC